MFRVTRMGSPTRNHKPIKNHFIKTAISFCFTLYRKEKRKKSNRKRLHFLFISEMCRFPPKWEGTWFQSGVRTPITIELNRLSNKGRCLASEGDKFLVVDE